MNTIASFFETPKSDPVTSGLILTSEGIEVADIPRLHHRKILFSRIGEVNKLPGTEKWKISVKDQTFGFLIDDSAWIKALFALSPELKTPQNRPGASLPVFRIFLLIVLCGAVIVSGLYLATPRISDIAAQSVPWKWEQELGENLMNELLKNEQTDKEKTALVRELYRQTLPLEEEEKGLPPIEITVLRKDEFNAFAIPGRRIVIYTGALASMKTREELLAILGHEAGHVVGRHSILTLFRSLSTFALVSFFAGDISGVMALLLQNAHSLQQMSYSRDFEREADKKSHEYLCRNAANPEGLVRLMQALRKKYGQMENKEFSFINSHPLTGERIVNARQEIARSHCHSITENPILDSLFFGLKKLEGK